LAPEGKRVRADKTLLRHRRRERNVGCCFGGETMAQDLSSDAQPSRGERRSRDDAEKPIKAG
jgi:hypothetical protein